VTSLRSTSNSVDTFDAVASGHLRALTSTAFFMLAICWSPLLPGLLSVQSSWAFLAAFVVYVGLVFNKRGVDVPLLVLSTLLIMCCLLLFLATGSETLLARTLPLPLLVFAAHQTASIDKLPEAICRVLSVYLVAGVVLSIIGFAYAYAGGQPLLSIANPDGRENSLFLTTMTNVWFETIIRPSFIYDEPGAFSFIVCATVALREVLGKSARTSYFLMLGGLITFSLAHVLVLLLFLVARLGILKTCLIAAAVSSGAILALSASDEFNFFTSRFAIEDGRLAGDNRSNQLDNLAEVIDPEIFLFGDIACHNRPDRTCPEHGDISSSPATPVYRGGLLLLTAQIVTHAALIVAFFRRKAFRFAALALSLLLLQRPSFEGFGYGLITYMTLFVMFKRSSSRRQRTPMVRFSNAPHLSPSGS